VRAIAGQLLSTMVDRLGGARLLDVNKEIADKILTVAAQMVMDGSLEVRYGHKMNLCFFFNEILGCIFLIINKLESNITV